MRPSPPEDTPDAAVKPPAFGHLSGIQKDTMYHLGEAGFVYTSPWVCTPRTSRYAATLLLSTNGRPFVLQGERQAITAQAAFVPSRVPRTLDARDVGLVSINVTPGHPAYAELRRRGGDALLALETSPFDTLHADLCRAYRAELAPAQARRMVDLAVDLLLAQLPGKAASPSKQSVELLSIVVAQPNLSLPEVAQRAGLSYDRASHALREVLGVPLKSYQCWWKMNGAAEALFTDAVSMTEVAHQAGFADSAHLSRSFKQQLGLSPSYLRQAANVRIMR